MQQIQDWLSQPPAELFESILRAQQAKIEKAAVAKLKESGGNEDVIKVAYTHAQFSILIDWLVGVMHSAKHGGELDPQTQELSNHFEYEILSWQ